MNAAKFVTRCRECGGEAHLIEVFEVHRDAAREVESFNEEIFEADYPHRSYYECQNCGEEFRFKKL